MGRFGSDRPPGRLDEAVMAPSAWPANSPSRRAAPVTGGVISGGWAGPLGPAPCGAGGSVLLAARRPTPRSPNDTDNGVWDQDRPKKAKTRPRGPDNKQEERDFK